ncbi:MAG: MG2 domain-containing protein [Bacteroides pyogenes]|uniref:alpha-2-macroglobulin family protein n=1 Tax=Bacteroides pyogenes TaxID=310300 RepID=UPI00242C21C8|nr:alpha-2-macroglobulin family protein [Bacteroides pyogenes]MCI7069968.1 MG2 domain-containing protein [Bacteroides pyogenes]
MRIKNFVLLLMLGIMGKPVLRAQTFDGLWKQVQEAEEKSLPKTVIRLTDEIFRKGEREKNTPQMLKAYMWRMKYKEELSPDSFYVGLKGLEAWAENAGSPADRSVLHSLIADIYSDYAGRNAWQLGQRQEIAVERPATDDIREWPANIFVQKVREHVQAAIGDSLSLLRTSTGSYLPFVVQGETSEYFHHDLYHLLASRGIRSLREIKEVDRSGKVKRDIASIYEKMTNTYRKRGDKEGYVLVKLERLKWENDEAGGFRPLYAKKGRADKAADAYDGALELLKTEYGSVDVCAEVYLAQALYAVDRDKAVRALQLCDEAIRRYPKYRRINALKNLRNNILSPSLTVSTEQVAYPGGDIQVKVNHKNVDAFTLLLYRNGKIVMRERYALKRPDDYLPQDTVFTCKAPEAGKYELRVVSDPRSKDNEAREFHVTRFKVLVGTMPDGGYEVLTLDAKTGHPIPKAWVAFYDSSERELLRVETGSDGKANVVPKKGFRYLKAGKGGDVAMPPQWLYNNGRYGRYSDEVRTVEMLTLLTDRSVYRPGQTVYVKGVAYTRQQENARVMSGREYTLTLRDANNQEVTKEEVRTNEFGSFTASFTLPSSGLNGMYALNAAGTVVSFRVEEYKRPTFDVALEKPAEGYRLGDRVMVKGKACAFSGAPLSDVPVKYTVKRHAFFFWRSMGAEQIASGEVTADANGEFSIPVSLERKEEDRDRDEDDVYDSRYYRYVVEAVVTNQAGETQSGTQVLVAGDRSLLVWAALQEKTCKDAPIRLTCKVKNLNGVPVAVEGTYALFRAKDAEAKSVEENPVLSGVFTSNKEMEFDWKRIPSGQYVFRMSVKDKDGKEVTAEEKTVLFSASDKRPPVKTSVWLYEDNTKFDASHPAVFCFGTSEHDAYVLMNVFGGNERLESKVLKLSDEIVRFEYSYKKEYGDGILVHFCMVRDGKLYQKEVRLEKRRPEKTLAMKWEVFRDKLRPGQQEEWRLTVRTPQGKPAVAEMLATMYDASLDRIWKQTQGFDLYYDLRMPRFGWNAGYLGTNAFYGRWERNLLKVDGLVYDAFSFPRGYGYWEKIVITGYGGKTRGGKSKNLMIRGVGVVEEAAPMMLESAQVARDGFAADAEVKTETDDAGEEFLSESPAYLRTNLAETAFFYPQLRTNEQGEVVISFTMPESLTRWNFRAYAHTKEMMTGVLNAEAVTSKEFMITPNLPRFVRVGDETSIAASIANMTETQQSGTVKLTLFDPLTEKVISTQEQDFVADAGKNAGVSFRFTATDRYRFIGCRLTAESGAFSDGEQQLLPVLSNKEHLTETLAMPVRGEQKRVFSLDKLFNERSETATDRRLTVEFTGNPAWYAVQALPSLGIPESDNAIAWATALYANTLASHIMNSQPRVKSVFESWKLQGGTRETFLSNLQKNQELKNILLAESPWVLEAQTEQQQKERVSALFDLNNLRDGSRAILAKLEELQEADGSWVWYPGMRGSRYVTTYIAVLNARLALLTDKRPEGKVAGMQRKALDYLHREALEEYRELLKLKKKGMKLQGISGMALQYLYLMAVSEEAVPAANKTAYAYFLAQTEKLLSSPDMPTKAIAAIVLDKAGRKKESQAFVASIKEHLTKTDELGMFFDFNENPYSWGGMKLQAHVGVMEALMLTGGNDATVEEMKFWLLKQKQTQQWSSPVATADAVYALLMKGANLLDNPGDVRVVIGNEVIETYSPAKTTVPVLGYVKRSFTEPGVLDARTVEVEKRDPGIAWGAVYAQYESPIGDVKQHGGELNVQKQLYVERTMEGRPQLQPVTEKTVLQVGDKVTSRLTIRLDRTMDFVQLKDQRAACFEPVGNLSGYRWDNGFGYYVDVKDASSNFFFDHLGKGVYVLEYTCRVSRRGVYESGMATMQCAYAPEYASHSGSERVEVK